jgi:hypothetical protein
MNMLYVLFLDARSNMKKNDDAILNKLKRLKAKSDPRICYTKGYKNENDPTAMLLVLKFLSVPRCIYPRFHVLSAHWCRLLLIGTCNSCC